jgi:8-oxo-dGTP pyrophosphatase MutT (NUDIX family)
MYKIYINETPLYLKSTAELSESADSRTLVARYAGRPKFLLHYADMLEKGKRFDRVILYADQLEQLFQDFVSHYVIVKAAGGVVQNSNNEVLFIFRRGWWDLPKGKIDNGETPAAAALREVMEETGLQQLVLGESLDTTWHTYREGKQRILKVTYWYKMQSDATHMTPQVEEGIEKVCWLDAPTFLNQQPKLYASIRDVLEQAIEI